MENDFTHYDDDAAFVAASELEDEEAAAEAEADREQRGVNLMDHDLRSVEGSCDELLGAAQSTKLMPDEAECFSARSSAARQKLLEFETILEAA